MVRFVKRLFSKNSGYISNAENTDLIPKYIMAYCILHNICLLQNDIIDIPIIINEPNIAQLQLEKMVNRKKILRKEMRLCICYQIYNYI